jgi:hypothetical protein
MEGKLARSRHPRRPSASNVGSAGMRRALVPRPAGCGCKDPDLDQGKQLPGREPRVSWGRDNVCVWDVDTSLGRAQSPGTQPHDVSGFRYRCCWRKAPATTLRIHVRTIPVCYRCPPSARGPRNGSTRWHQVPRILRSLRSTLRSSAQGIVASTEGFVAGTARLCARARASSQFSPSTSSVVGDVAPGSAGPVGPGADDPVRPAGSFRPDVERRPSTSFAAIHPSPGTARNRQEPRQPAARHHAR